MRRKSAFTLIELLVVVAIIAVLIAILLPSLGRAREQAKRTQCGTKLRAIATAALTYAQANSDSFMNAAALDGGAFEKDYDWVTWRVSQIEGPTALPQNHRRHISQRGIGPFMNLNVSNRNKLLICPSDTDAISRTSTLPSGPYRYSYTLNWNMTCENPNGGSAQAGQMKPYKKIGNVKNRDAIFFMEESRPDDGCGAYWHGANVLRDINLPSPRHDLRAVRNQNDTMNGGNRVPNSTAVGVCAFIDGHVEWLPRKVVNTRKANIGNLSDFPPIQNPDPAFD